MMNSNARDNDVLAKNEPEKNSNGFNRKRPTLLQKIIQQRAEKTNNSNNLYASRLQRRCRSRSFVHMN